MDSRLPRRVGQEPLQPTAGVAGPAVADLRLTQRVLAREANAHRELAEALAPLPAMLRIKNAKLGCPLGTHELEDATQNALMAILEKLDGYDGRVPLLRWAYGFGAIEVFRAMERRARRREQEHKSDVVIEPRRNDADGERLATALASLDADDRAVIERRHFTEQPFDRIAAELALPLSTVKSRYYRGLQRLRDKLRAAEVANP